MENKLTQKEINKIIENHKHWLNKDVDGWENMKANFSNQDLSYANLSGAYLHGADFSGANLRYAYLCGAYLRNADLSRADLSDAHLCGANLRNADLRGADLCDANLSGTDIRGADIGGADIRGANLSNADLSGTKNMMYIPMACPEEGSFIGFKKAAYADKYYIVKLEIPVDALRSSATSRKCRCNKAKVLEIQNIDGSKANIDVVHSIYDPSFQYKTGQIVEEPKYDDNRFNVCSKGIHFFINRQEVVDF